MWCWWCYGGEIPLKVCVGLTMFLHLRLCLQITCMEELSQSCRKKYSKKSRGERENNIHRERERERERSVFWFFAERNM